MGTNQEAEAVIAQDVARMTAGRASMLLVERAAACGRYGTTRVDEAQADQIARLLPAAGVELSQAVADPLWAVDADGDPHLVFKLDVAGLAMIVWTYTAPHTPQVLLFATATIRDAAWAKLAKLEAEAAEANERNGVVGPQERARRAAAVLGEVADLAYRAGSSRDARGCALEEIQRRARKAQRQACPHRCRRGRLCNGCGCPGCGFPGVSARAGRPLTA